MKILATADWHIGKIINGFSMIEDQRYILNQIVEIIEEKKPDVLIIAGDIYDRSIAPIEAVELLDDFLTKVIIDCKIPVLIVSGNHDSAERLSFGNKLLQNKGLHIEGVSKKEIKKVTLTDEYGPVNFYLVPFSSPSHIRELLEDREIKTYDKAMRRVIDLIKPNLDTNERNILVTHGFVVKPGKDKDAVVSDSERILSIGGAEHINCDAFDAFDVVTLGHLHGPQKVDRDTIRYPGSILKYSFSEVNHNKSLTYMELNDKEQVNIDLIPLKPMRDMRIIKGELKELIKPEVYKEANCLDYIQVKLTDRTELVDPINTLRSVYPNVMQIEHENLSQAVDVKTKASGEFKEMSKLELFSEFYENISGCTLSKEQFDILSIIFEEIEFGGEK